MGMISRRDFLKAAGIGAASLAWLAGAGLPGAEESWLVEGAPDAKTLATVCGVCPAGCGLHLQVTADGGLRIGANPLHPRPGGEACALLHGALLGPQRATLLPGPLHQVQRGSRDYASLDWAAGIAALRQALFQYRPDEIVILVGLFPDHVFDFMQRLAVGLGGASVLRFGLYSELEGEVTLTDAAHTLFGAAQIPYFDVEAADVVFSFGASLGEAWLSTGRVAGETGWSLPAQPVRRSYWVQFDAIRTNVAEQADEWVHIQPGSEAVLAQALTHRVAALRSEGQAGLEDPLLAEAALTSGIGQADLERLARLFAGVGRALAVPGASALGGSHGLAAAEAILALNSLAENLGRAGGLYLVPALPVCTNPAGRPATLAEMTVLVERMRCGQVKALLVYGADPLGELPASLGFQDALAAVERVVSFSPVWDATSTWADVLLPDHLPLESWGYQRLRAGSDRPVLSALQPVRQSPRNTRPAGDVLLEAVSGELPNLPFESQLDFVQQSVFSLNSWGGIYQAADVQEFWAAWQQAGGWWTPAAVRMPPVALAGIGFSQAGTSSLEERADFPLRLLLLSQPEPAEAEQPWIALRRQTAQELGVRAGQQVKVCSAAGAVQVVVRLEAGQEVDLAAMPLRWGKKLLGMAVNESGSLAWAQTTYIRVVSNVL
jgi:anaerobic selenocysteine-containing dehydrogenase